MLTPKKKPLKAKPKAKATKRNYTLSGEGKYDKSPKRMADNRARKKARYAMEKGGSVTKGDGKDVDHKDGNPRNNAKSNLRVQSASTNRSYPRNKKAGKK
jgi:hypothetical protein|tara:strand:- start:731 stop:1030 length:300 start_codon:yes stop_codon:yes gene_type:complete